VRQIEVWMTERYIAAADPQNILEPPTVVNICDWIIFLLIIFSVLMTQHFVTLYNIDDTKAAG